ncbi:MAG TPA: 5'-3' exonuclease H3TH domain-containing protein [Candidatus Paceibacterota bacterium]|nr:5'-3' exonuclease H3TH domain-containing protein [Candidatus Paceibacterota bacterium]
MKTLLLIDANSLIHRSFHALPPLTSRDGTPVQALYGISSILLRLWREGRPDYAAALFDRPEPTFRKKKYAAYKAQRPAAPAELISQIIEAHRLFEAFGIRVFEKPGFEADDLIATFAEKFSVKNKSASGGKKDNDLQVVILTGDRDTLQLVEDEKIVVRTFKTGVSDTLTYDEKTVMEKYGLLPRQLVDYKAFVGDASDNIKGVPGIGPKTAAEILKKYGTLEAAFEGAKNDPKLEKRIGPFRNEAEFSKELVVLDRHAPVEIGSVEELRVGEEGARIRTYFEAMHFETLINRLKGENRKTATVPKTKKRPQQGLF